MSKQIVSRKPDAPYGWEPREMIFSDDLSLKAKGLWLYINTKPVGWEFSSVRIAKEIQEGERSIRHTLQELIDKGYLVRHKFADGRVDYELLVKPVGTNASLLKQQTAEPHDIIYKEDINRKSNTKKDLVLSDDNTKGADAEVTYGKAEINQLFELWKTATGLPITSNTKKNRYACNNLLNKYGLDGVEKLIRVVERAQTDRYAPRVADFCDLQAKLNQLLVWAKGQTVNTQVISVEDF